MTGEEARRPTQLPLPLDFRPALGREDFLVAEANRDAVYWLDAWPSWPAPALVVHGPAGCGKTHLAHVFAARTKGPVIRLADLTEDALPALARTPLVVDGAVPATPEEERRLLHLYNLRREFGNGLLLTAPTPPARWPVTLADLMSRLRAAPAVAVGPPDDTLMIAVLGKLFADRHLWPEDTVLSYLARHTERSFASARRVVTLLDQHALANKRRVTVPLARQVLQSEAGEMEHRIAE